MSGFLGTEPRWALRRVRLLLSERVPYCWFSHEEPCRPLLVAAIPADHAGVLALPVSRRWLSAALAWMHQPHPASCSITPATTPFAMTVRCLPVSQFASRSESNSISFRHLPAAPVPFFWNNSVWTLLPEVFCYFDPCWFGLTQTPPTSARCRWTRLRCLACRGGVRLAGTGKYVVALFRPLHVLPPSLLFGLISLAPAFLAGAVLYLYRDKVPDSGWLALGFVVVFVAGARLPFFGQGMARFSHFLPGPTSVMAPALAYPLIWLGIHLPSPFQRVGARNDYSYGVTFMAGPSCSFSGCGVCSIGGTWSLPHQRAGSVVLAVLSWHLVEKRALSLKKADPRVILTFGAKRLKGRSAAIARSDD